MPYQKILEHLLLLLRFLLETSMEAKVCLTNPMNKLEKLHSNRRKLGVVAEISFQQAFYKQRFFQLNLSVD